MFRKRKKRYLKVILCLGILLTITSSYAMWDRLSDTATATIKLETQTQSFAEHNSKMSEKPMVKSKTAEPVKESTQETQTKETQPGTTGQGADTKDGPTEGTVE